MSFADEFGVVELLLKQDYETRGVDAFALSVIKAERQLRKLVTHLVYQFPCFGQKDRKMLRDVLERNKGVFADGLRRGFDALYPRSIENLIGADYDRLNRRLDEARKHRNKIFHGQLTTEGLTRSQLVSYVGDIRKWCETLAQACTTEFRYDGFERNSFRKSEVAGLWKSFRFPITDARGYEQFVKNYMQRPAGKGCSPSQQAIATPTRSS
jgi:hypothetical protein